jgi:hypothetical protein
MLRKSSPSYLSREQKEGEQQLDSAIRHSLFVQTERDVSDPRIRHILTLGGDMEATGPHKDRVILACPL